MGWSEPGSGPRDANHIVEELHTLLVNGGIAGPYVLTGWSFGGLYMRVFADHYAKEVAGLVLLDSSFPDQCTSTPEGVAQCRKIRTIYRIAPPLAAIGVLRVMGYFQPPSGLPEPQNSEVLASFSATKDWRTQSAEYAAAPAMNEQARASILPKDIPLFVVTATEHDTSPAQDQLWQEWQRAMSALSTNSVQRVVEGASHSSLLFDANDAQASIDAILRVVEAARSGTRLADTR
jgi:thioesterase domain-containing protein